MNRPVFDYVKKYLDNSFISFHTPGHKGQLSAHKVFSGYDFLKFDLPDDICGFPGARDESEKWASSVYGTLKTKYLVNGSTSGVNAMFCSCFYPGDRVLAGRNLHISAVSAMIKTGVIPEYIPIECEMDGTPLNTSLREIRTALWKDPDIKGIFLTTPSYYGVALNISGISDVLGEACPVLLVDEAWGAHFPFSPLLPPSALDAGVDMAVHGAHKTLPAVTGSALLHLCSGRIHIERVEDSLTLTETTSPNMFELLSVEYAINLMNEKGEEIIEKALDYGVRIREFIDENTDFDTGYDNISAKDDFQRDPLKVLIKTNYEESGITGYQLSESLIKGGIVPEMSDLYSILLIITGFEEEEHLSRLFRVLEQVTCESKGKPEKSVFPNAFPQIPRMDLSPREAFFAKGETIRLEKSRGRTVKSFVVPYPPGTPLLIPGEIISGEDIEYQKMMINHGGVIRGIRDWDDPLIEVVK